MPAQLRKGIYILRIRWPGENVNPPITDFTVVLIELSPDGDNWSADYNWKIKKDGPPEGASVPFSAAGFVYAGESPESGITIGYFMGSTSSGQPVRSAAAFREEVLAR